MRIGTTVLLFLVLATAGVARADMAPYPTNFEVEQDGPDVHVRMDTCSDCYPRELLVRRVGDETVEVGVLSVHDAEVIEEYDDEWSQTNVWSVVELVDRCVPAEPGGTKYTYEFVREVAWEEQVRHDDSIRVQQNGFCQTEAGQEAGCAASISGSRVASATPMVLGLLMVLVGVATMRMTRREE